MKKLISSCLCVLGVVVLSDLVGRLIGSFVTAYILKEFLSELVYVIFAMGLLLILKKTSILKFKLHGIGDGLLAGTPLFALCGLILLSFLVDHDPITESAISCILFALFTLLIGIYEEVLFRGIIQNAFHDYFGCETPGSVRKAIIWAGVVFGLTHLVNVFHGSGFVPVIIQALTVIPVGILFGTVYYRSERNIWTCILLHALNDFLVMLESGILSGRSIASGINEYSGMKLVSIALYAVILVVLMRDSKLGKKPEENSLA